MGWQRWQDIHISNHSLFGKMVRPGFADPDLTPLKTSLATEDAGPRKPGLDGILAHAMSTK